MRTCRTLFIRIPMSDLTQATIEDFGAQWQRYRDNKDYYGSVALLKDLFGPLLESEAVAGKNVAEIGSGSGRIVLMLLKTGAARVTAVEPSEAMGVLRANTAAFSSRVEYVHGRGEAIPPAGNFDFVFSIGVLHHIPDPDPVVRAAFQSLRPGGRMLVWLYGWEGNEAYLWWALPVRKVTRRLPDLLLAGICHCLNVALAVYIWLCRILPLPMRAYMRGHIGKLSWHARYLTLFDQLNPSEARYYRKAEAQALLEKAGFRDVQLFHRHGYSWTVIGTRPDRV
jgi:SAM-dependent methyltransferase